MMVWFLVSTFHPEVASVQQCLAHSDGGLHDLRKAFTHSTPWGRWVESAEGCYLLEKADELEYQLYYWRENDEEVDFVIARGEHLVAIEVKSGRL